MAATGNEAVKLSQFKTVYDKLETDINTKLGSDDIVAGANVTVDTDTQPGKVVVSAEGGEQYITSVKPANMKVADGELSFTDGSEFFELMGGGMFGYQLAENCLPVRTLANGDEQIACIVLDSTQFKAVDGSPTYQEHPLLTLNYVNNLAHLQDYYVSTTIHKDDPVQIKSPITAMALTMFPALPSQDAGAAYRPDYGTAGAVLSSNGDKTFSWKAIDSSGGSIDPGSIGTTELANSGVTTEKIADGAVTSGKIAMHAVDTQQLAVGSVTSNILAADSVTANKIQNRAITEFKLAVNCVTANNMADSAVTTAKLANDAVTTAKLADNSVAAANLMTGSVTSEKIADGAVTVTDLNTAVVNRLVPTGGSASAFLCGDGTWKTPANTTYTAGDGLKLTGTAFSVNFVSDEDFDSYFGL